MIKNSMKKKPFPSIERKILHVLSKWFQGQVMGTEIQRGNRWLH